MIFHDEVMFKRSLRRHVPTAGPKQGIEIMIFSLPWIGLRDFTVKRRWAIGLAILAFVLYFAAVVAGSELQDRVLPNLSMGWLQQVASALMAIGVATALGKPTQLLGLVRPEGQWIKVAIGVGISIALLGTLADWLTPTPSSTHDVEYFVYQATMPGIGEELGFRGLFLGLLTTAGVQQGWPRAGGFWLLATAALPFTLLHLLELDGMALLTMSIYTFYAAIALGWTRMVSGSIWPAVVAHNIANVAGGLVSLASAG
jgi:uncharacterized protein